ncbi:FAD-dependent oxidoreductase, partial [Micromonospora sp. NPDC047753]|uniref:FAD-dependent oxidoreductase n=1 Tax=Micromonospora sp. NPDC047753 TaxID=3154817 RepID=UPI0033D75CB8
MVEQAEIVRDVVVVGGGAAGLSAALILARSRRRVTVLDAGAPRNAPAQAVHGLLALDGLSPLELLRRGRDGPPTTIDFMLIDAMKSAGPKMMVSTRG